MILWRVCRWRLLIYLDKKYSLFQRPLCVTCMLRSLNKYSDESLGCHRFRKLVCRRVTKGLSVAHNCFRPATFTTHSDTHTTHRNQKKCVAEALGLCKDVGDLKGGVLQSFSDKVMRTCEGCLDRPQIFLQ